MSFSRTTIRLRQELAHIVAAANEVGIEEEDTRTLLDIMGTTRADVVTR
jgi:hypothetical protein